jgi:hypothetical protein
VGKVIDLGEDSGLTRSAVVQRIYDFLQANMPAGEDGIPWQPATGALDDLLVNAHGQQVDELARLLSIAATSIFRKLGLKVHKVAPIESRQATASTTWVNSTAFPQTVPAGTSLSVDNVAFTVDTETTIAASGSAPVTITARDGGIAGNDLGASIIARDNLGWAPSITIATGTLTSAGADAESDEEYLARLVDELELLSRAAITIDDFARITQRVAGVGRVLVLPRFNPAAPGVESPGWVTLVPQNDTNGHEVDESVADAILALFANGARAIVPIQVALMAPTFTAAPPTVVASYWPGYEPATVEAQIAAQMAAFYNALTWGSPTGGDGDETWIDDHVVSALALAGAIENADSIRRVEEISIGAGADRADFTMTGVATLPLLGSPDITVEPIS